MATERARFESLVHGRSAKDLHAGIKFHTNFTPEKARDPRFKTKFSSSAAWRHGDSAAMRARRAISRSPGQPSWSSDALGRRDTLAPCALSVVNRAFLERSNLPCTPPHKTRLRVGMFHEQPSSPFSSLRRGATQDVKPALAVGHTQRFASHKANSMMSPPQSREGSPTRAAQAANSQSLLPGHLYPFGAHKRVNPTPPTYRDVLSNAANRPHHAWDFNEMKPQSRRHHVSRMSMPVSISEAMKPSFSVSNLVPASHGPPPTAVQYRNTHSPTRLQPAPPSTAPAGRLRSNSIGTDTWRHPTPDQCKPLPSKCLANLPPVAPGTCDPRPLKRSTLELHTGPSAHGLEASSAQSFSPRTTNPVQPAEVSSPATADQQATDSPLNPQAQPFVPQKSKLTEVCTPSHPIATATNVSSDSPDPACRTGLSSHPCVDSDLHSTPSGGSPHNNLRSPELQSPALGAERASILSLNCHPPLIVASTVEQEAPAISAAEHEAYIPMDTALPGASSGIESDMSVLDQAVEMIKETPLSFQNPLTEQEEVEACMSIADALEPASPTGFVADEAQASQGAGAIEDGGDVRMASSAHGSVSLNGGELVKSIVNQLKESNFAMDSDVDAGSNEDDHHSWVSIDDEDMSNEEEWATVDHMDGYSDATPYTRDLAALTATPDTMSECSLHTGIPARGRKYFTQSTGTVRSTDGPGVIAHTIPTLETQPPHTMGHTAVYDNINGNITLTESEPQSLYTAVSGTSVASRVSIAPNHAVYGQLSAEELDDVFGDVNEHPNDRVVDGMRRLNNKYIALRKVGEGAYGKVFECTDADTGTQKVAVKLFRISPTDTDAEDVKRTARREAYLMESLSHPHIVNCKELFWIEDKVAIVMEFVPRTLLEALEDREQEYEQQELQGHQIDAGSKGLPRFRVREVMLHLLKAVAFLHEREIVYRDIKPENVLLRDDGTVQLCDFGFARYFAGDSPGAQDPLTDYVGTRWYRAPELLLGLNQHGVGPAANYIQYSKAVDLWAIGCLMGELVTGDPLFPGDSDIDQLFKVREMVGEITIQQRTLFQTHPDHKHLHLAPIQKPETLQAHFGRYMNAIEVDFMEGLLDVDPKKRRSASDCLQHPYLADPIVD